MTEPATQSNDEPLLNIAGVSVRFGGVAALQSVDLQIHAGSTHCIIGPNGAGKSTLVNVLTGQLRPNEGHVRFDGRSLDAVQPHDINQRGIARVFQTPAIFDELTLLDNVTIAALARRDGKCRLNLPNTGCSLAHPSVQKAQRAH